jgi:hypothetical protein
LLIVAIFTGGIVNQASKRKKPHLIQASAKNRAIISIMRKAAAVSKKAKSSKFK